MGITHVTERELALERENVKLTQAVRMQAALIETLQSQPADGGSEEFQVAVLKELADVKQTLIAAEGRLDTHQRMLANCERQLWENVGEVTAQPVQPAITEVRFGTQEQRLALLTASMPDHKVRGFSLSNAHNLAQPVAPDRQAFIRWAKSHDTMDMVLAAEFVKEGEIPVCENGWMPATFFSAMTEIAWRAWANCGNAQPVHPKETK